MNNLNTKRRSPYTKRRSPYSKRRSLYTKRRSPYTARKLTKKTAVKNRINKRTLIKKPNTFKLDNCRHWFRINNKEKVDCLIKDGKESDTPLKILIGSAQNNQRGNYRKIVEDFLDDDSALGYFMTKPNKEKASLLGLFMVLQGGEYGVSYGLPSQKWLDICVKAKMKNN